MGLLSGLWAKFHFLRSRITHFASFSGKENAIRSTGSLLTVLLYTLVTIRLIYSLHGASRQTPGSTSRIVRWLSAKKSYVRFSMTQSIGPNVGVPRPIALAGSEASEH